MFGYFHHQRQLDREMFLQVAKETMSQAKAQTDLLIEQTKLLQSVMEMFKFEGQPSSRVMTDAREAEIEREGWKDGKY